MTNDAITVRLDPSSRRHSTRMAFSCCGGASRSGEKRSSAGWPFARIRTVVVYSLLNHTNCPALYGSSGPARVSVPSAQRGVSAFAAGFCNHLGREFKGDIRRT
jgi:hypothetical protein